MKSKCVGIAAILCARAVFGGDLNPPGGPVAPTPGPEPRIPIDLIHTPGDADSVYKITAPGSYYLTGNVTGQGGKHGIEIDADGVAVDLMGFDLEGVPGSINGVSTTVAGHSNIEIRNGSLRGWGLDGIDLATSSASSVRVESIRSFANTRNGINVAAGSSISSCISEGNFGNGIAVGDGSTVIGCVSRSSGVIGILTASGCTLSQCSASLSVGVGFALSNSCSVTGCSAYDNGDNGFTLGAGSVATQDSAYANGGDGFQGSVSVKIVNCNSSVNQGDGIQISGDSLAIGNMCDSNGFGAADGAGIHCISSDTRIEGNNCTDNDRGIDLDVAGSLVIRNICSGNATNWDIVAGNAVAPIVNASTNAAAILGSTYAGSLGSTDPNANFSY